MGYLIYSLGNVAIIINNFIATNSISNSSEKSLLDNSLLMDNKVVMLGNSSWSLYGRFTSSKALVVLATTAKNA